MSEQEKEQQDSKRHREDVEYSVSLIVLNSEEEEHSFTFPLDEAPSLEAGKIPDAVLRGLAHLEQERMTKFYIKTSVAKIKKDKIALGNYGTLGNKVDTTEEILVTHYEAEAISMEEYVEMANAADAEGDPLFAEDNEQLAKDAVMMGQSFYQIPDGTMFRAHQNGIHEISETLTRQQSEHKDFLSDATTGGESTLLQKSKVVLVENPALPDRPLRKYIMQASGDMPITHLGSPKLH